MNSPYNFLKNVLTSIEERLKDKINIDVLANDFNISTTHLHRLFKFAFDQTIGSYIRSRKLASSIDDLLNTDMDILDIAMEYDFEYEQSYIRSFKREYGITPGNFRRKGQILKVTPPLTLFDSQKVSNGVLFGLDIVVIPKFFLIGVKHQIKFRDALYLGNIYFSQFKNEERYKIKNAVNPEAMYIISRTAENDADYFYNTYSLQVKSIKNIPKGFTYDVFESSLCARFRYMYKGDGCLEQFLDKMFNAIDDFMNDENQKYFLERKRVNIDIYDLSDNETEYRLLEWFAPVRKKTDMDIAKSSGIINTYRQKLPALRFIGKKCDMGKDYSGDEVLKLIDTWQFDGLFDIIEKQSDRNLKSFYDGGNAYISLIKSKNDKIIEHWIGIFMPDGTKVPKGYNKIDFPITTVDVCTVYGKRKEVVNFDSVCRNKTGNESANTAKWSFQRFNWHRFFEEDLFGKRLLDYCYYKEAL